MPTLTPPAVDETLTDTVDLTAEVPCSTGKRQRPCPRPAVWIVYPPCGHPAPSYEVHRRYLDAWCASHPTRIASCNDCQARVPDPIDWRPL
ncbi:hypothetical protein GCM10027059_26120 [Myceligenerans halotolerans]